MTETVRSLSVATIPAYAGPHAIEGIRFREARQALGVTAWGMNVIEFDPGCEGYPEHDHVADGQEEVYVVLEGEVVLVADGEEQVLPAGSLCRVAPSVTRKLITRGSGAVVLAVGATPGEVFVPRM